MCPIEKLCKDTGVSELISLYKLNNHRSFTMKSENTYNQKLAHCVRWHPHLKLSFSQLLHFQPWLVCANTKLRELEHTYTRRYKKEMM